MSSKALLSIDITLPSVETIALTSTLSSSSPYSEHAMPERPTATVTVVDIEPPWTVGTSAGAGVGFGVGAGVGAGMASRQIANNPLVPHMSLTLCHSMVDAGVTDTFSGLELLQS